MLPMRLFLAFAPAPSISNSISVIARARSARVSARRSIYSSRASSPTRTNASAAPPGALLRVPPPRPFIHTHTLPAPCKAAPIHRGRLARPRAHATPAVSYPPLTERRVPRYRGGWGWATMAHAPRIHRLTDRPRHADVSYPPSLEPSREVTTLAAPPQATARLLVHFPPPGPADVLSGSSPSR